MNNETKIEKVRILENDFPANISEDIGNKPLEIVNRAGETVALFYNISFLKGKFTDPIDFVRLFDFFFDPDLFHYELPDSLDRDLYDDEDQYEEDIAEYNDLVKAHPNFDFFAYRVLVPYPVRVMIGLCRLAYPFHPMFDQRECEYQINIRCQDEIDEVSELVLHYADVHIAAKFMNVLIRGRNPNLAEEYLSVLVKNSYLNNLYENPDLFLPDQRNLDFFFKMAEELGITQLKSFLIDYQEKH